MPAAEGAEGEEEEEGGRGDERGGGDERDGEGLRVVVGLDGRGVGGERRIRRWGIRA